MFRYGHYVLIGASFIGRWIIVRMTRDTWRIELADTAAAGPRSYAVSYYDNFFSLIRR